MLEYKRKKALERAVSEQFQLPTPDVTPPSDAKDDNIAESPLLTYGVYRVEETKAPEHFVDAGFSTEVSITKDNLQTYEISVENEPTKGWIKLTKADGEVVAVITTGENGVAESPLLTYGVYKVEETVVPEHFVDNGFSVDVTIADDNLKTYEVVVENEPTKGWIRLTKTNSLDSHPIAGVQFNIYYYDEFGSGLAASMVTDENGVATSPALRKGKYLVQEVDEATGYVSDLVELTAMVESDETTYLSVTNQPMPSLLYSTVNVFPNNRSPEWWSRVK